MTDSLQLIQLIRQSMEVVMHRSWHDQGHFVKATGLSMAQFGILMQLHYQQQHGGISEISSRMEITSAAASQLVDKLVQGELIERSEDPHDRRAKQLRLTEKGQALVHTAIQMRSRWVDELIAVLTPAEFEAVAAGFAVLNAAARRLDPPTSKN